MLFLHRPGMLIKFMNFTEIEKIQSTSQKSTRNQARVLQLKLDAYLGETQNKENTDRHTSGFRVASQLKTALIIQQKSRLADFVP